MKIATIDAARLDPSRHVFVPKIGYVVVGDLPKPRLDARGTCLPPDGFKNNSVHKLKTPHGITVKLTWKDGLWWPLNSSVGNRLAWPPSHLAQAGWSVTK